MCNDEELDVVLCKAETRLEGLVTSDVMDELTSDVPEEDGWVMSV